MGDRDARPVPSRPAADGRCGAAPGRLLKIVHCVPTSTNRILYALRSVPYRTPDSALS